MAIESTESVRVTITGRLDRVLVGQLPGLSRARIQEMIRAGKVQVNGRPVRKPGTPVGPSDLIQLARLPRPSSRLRPHFIPLDILFENDNLIVINKPAGLVVHPGAGAPQSTLVQAVLAHRPRLYSVGEPGRPGIVHRLDKDTSGVIVVAKTEAALRELQQQFQRREVEKLYLALVDGAPPSPSGQIEAPLARSTPHRKRINVAQDRTARPAVTRFRVRERFAKHNLLEVSPHTGRTHQIRVHLQFLGCPVVGDRVYGRPRPSLPVTRQQLHAWRLSFRLPGEDRHETFEAAIPADLLAAIELARQL